MLEIVNRVYPEYTDSAKAYMSSKDIYYMNMYIMKKELFHTYMEWLFTLLDTFEQERKEINKPQEPRLYGYLAGAVVWYLLLLPEEERHTMCRASLS